MVIEKKVQHIFGGYLVEQRINVEEKIFECAKEFGSLINDYVILGYMQLGNKST